MGEARKMKPPTQACIDAVKSLTEHHQGDSAAYYSLDGESAVLVINDEEALSAVVHILQMVMGGEEVPLESSDAEEILAMMLMPSEPIEA